MGVEGHERLNWTVTTGTMSLCSTGVVSRRVASFDRLYHDNLNNPDDHNA